MAFSWSVCPRRQDLPDILAWSLSPHGEVRTQILAPIAAALDSGRAIPVTPPSLRGRCLKAIWRYITLSERFGPCVIGRVVGRSEISMQWRAHGSGQRVPPRSSTIPPAGCVGVRTSGLSEAETGSEPKVSPANACWPACSLRDWRLLSPDVLGEGSLWGVVPGAPYPPASAPPGRVPLCKGRCKALHHLLWIPAEVTGFELFPPGVSSVVASQIMPMVKGKVR